MIKNWK